MQRIGKILPKEFTYSARERNMPIRHRFSIVIIFALALLLAPQSASAQTKVRFTLDWIPGATHGAFLLALQKGYYKAEGLDVTIDRGKGSAEVVRQLASGVYDIGFPDINILMDFNSKNPDRAMHEVMMGHDRAAASIVV